MRRLLLSAVGAMALAGGATTANAVSVVSSTATNPASLAALTVPSTFTISDVMSGGPGSFSDMYSFTIIGTSALFDGQISSQEGSSGVQNINFTPAPTLTAGATGTGSVLDTFVKTSSDPNPETWAISSTSAILLGPGTYTLDVAGNLNGPNGSYVGNFNLDTAPVPEPATWAMMLLGFGAMGLAIRRRRKPVLAQVA